MYGRRAPGTTTIRALTPRWTAPGDAQISHPTVNPCRNTRSVSTSPRSRSGHDSAVKPSSAKNAKLAEFSGVVRDRNPMASSSLHPPRTASASRWQGLPHRGVLAGADLIVDTQRVDAPGLGAGADTTAAQAGGPGRRQRGQVACRRVPAATGGFPPVMAPACPGGRLICRRGRGTLRVADHRATPPSVAALPGPAPGDQRRRRRRAATDHRAPRPTTPIGSAPSCG